LNVLKFFFLPSRRVFNPYFSEGEETRKNYSKNTGEFNFRGATIDRFNHRLFNASNHYEAFSRILKRVCGKKIDWTIDQNENNQYYIKISKSTSVHNSDGLGEGIISLLFLVDCIFESTKDEILVIDEPELSLHPQLQRRLLKEFVELSKDRQIVIATHSPEMLDSNAIINGAAMARVAQSSSGSCINMLDDVSRQYFASFENDLNNPHVMG